jgi:hypothetical protein
MSDIYDDLLKVIDELYGGDEGFFNTYKLNHKFCRRNIIYHMNPVPFDIALVLHKFYLDIKPRFEGGDGVA